MPSYRKVSKWKVAGQAEIWTATKVETGEHVIMKRLLPDTQLADPEAELRRFHREVRSQRALDHDGIMPVLGYSFSTQPPWYVMPRAKRNLEDLIDGNPDGLSEQLVVDITLQVASAVEYAHSEGILHRDIKPGNVLELDGRWVVADFGLCRDINTNSITITKTNTIVGTVAYLAPEQFDDAHSVGPAADVFSIGRMMYHMLTGRPPFPYMNLRLLPAKFVFLISKAVQEQPGNRFASVAEMAQELALLSESDESMQAPMERAKTVLAAVLADQEGAGKELLELLLSNRDDESFYTEFVSGLPEPALEAMQVASEPGFRQVIEAFDEFADGSHPFSYTDTIANFCKRVFDVAIDPMIRQLVLKRIFTVGHEHNRYHVRSVFFKILTGLTDPVDTQIAINVIKGHYSATLWFGEVLSDFSVPPAVRSAFRQILE